MWKLVAIVALAVHRDHRVGRLTAVGCVAAVVIAVAGCGGTARPTRLDASGIPIGPVSVQWMERQPLAHLYYPGSKAFYMLGGSSDEQHGSAPAFAGAILTSSTVGAKVYAWYVRKLASLGWHFVTDNGCSSVQLSCPQFARTGHGIREVFFLGVDSPAELPLVIGRMPPHACTVYEMSFEIFPSGGTQVPRPGMSFNGGDSCWWTGTRWRTRAEMYP